MEKVKYMYIYRNVARAAAARWQKASPGISFSSRCCSLDLAPSGLLRHCFHGSEEFGSGVYF